MSLILILGETGTGKSTSIRTLDPTETFLIQAKRKELPYTKGRKDFILKTKENNGNKFITDNAKQIVKIIEGVAKDKAIKNLIIDDLYYVMSNEFMRRINQEKILKAKEIKAYPFEKFNDIGFQIWDIITAAEKVGEELNVFVLSHSDCNDAGRAKIKTIGKMIDNIVNVEGCFTFVFHAKVMNEKFVFQTRGDYTANAKTPMDMFKEKYIDNDLQSIIETIDKYYNEDVPQ